MGKYVWMKKYVGELNDVPGRIAAHVGGQVAEHYTNLRTENEKSTKVKYTYDLVVLENNPHLARLTFWRWEQEWQNDPEVTPEDITEELDRASE